MEIITQSPLSPESIRAEVAHLIALLDARRVREVEVEYGFGCEPFEASYIPTLIAVSDLPDSIEQSEAAGLLFAGSDLWIGAKDPGVEFLLCHEADIHLVTADLNFGTVKSRWIANGWKGYEGTGGESREWTEFR